MAIKIVVILSALVATACSFVSVVADQDSSSFSYDVADPNTGDYKSQTEVRHGDVVRGQYSLLDADGTYRIVDYTADDVNGFNAIVRKEPVLAGVTPAIVEASPVIAARNVAPVLPSYTSLAPAVVPSRTIATPVLEARTYEAPIISDAYNHPALFAKTYSPSLYSKNYALPSIAKTYGSPSVVATNAYSSPIVYGEPSLISSDNYGDYLSPYYSAYGVNSVDSLSFYKK